MNEAQRQSYLKAMGLTPWVARAPLPGAAPTPTLEWQQESATPGMVPETASEPEPARPASPPQADPQPVADSRPVAPTPMPQAKDRQPAPAPAAGAETASGASLTFTLEAHLGNGTWLLAAQQDAQAPGLGRFEAPLLANLLALFQARPERPRRFFCPLTDQPMPAAEAAQALGAFLKGLQQQTGGERVLLCLPEALSQSLFERPRYQPFTLGEMPALVVSSLAEMLETPAEHKKASWQAMQEHGFDGQ